MWQRLFGKGNGSELRGKGQYGWNIVGESRYQEALASIAGPKSSEGVWHHCTAELRKEPSNPHDENAIAVFISGKKVGYISRHRAKHIGRRMGGDKATVPAVINGGWKSGSKEEGHYGVKLDISR